MYQLQVWDPFLLLLVYNLTKVKSFRFLLKYFPLINFIPPAALNAPLRSFVFDGVSDSSALGWKYDQNPAFSNEFYQLKPISAPFVGVTSQRFDDIDLMGTWFVHK